MRKLPAFVRDIYTQVSNMSNPFTHFLNVLTLRGDKVNLC